MCITNSKHFPQQVADGSIEKLIKLFPKESDVLFEDIDKEGKASRTASNGD